MMYRCLPAAVLAALFLPTPASADSVSITVQVIQAGSVSLPSVIFRSGGVITLPTGNDAVAITIGGLNVGGLNGPGHGLRELSLQGAGPKWDNPSQRNGLSLERGHGFSGGSADSSVAADFSDSKDDEGEDQDGESGSGESGSNGGQNAALDRTVIFTGGGELVGKPGSDGLAALVLSGIANGAAVRAALERLGGNDGGSLLEVSGEQPIANPEPTSMLLLGTGLAGLAAIRRRRSVSHGPLDH